jgi:glutaconate CoA-transferase, subunit B
MYLASLHPGVELDDVLTNTGWDLKIADDLEVTPAPTEHELSVMRAQLDPEGIHTRGG